MTKGLSYVGGPIALGVVQTVNDYFCQKKLISADSLDTTFRKCREFCTCSVLAQVGLGSSHLEILKEAKGTVSANENESWRN